MKKLIIRDPFYAGFWLLRWLYTRYLLFILKRTAIVGKNVRLFVHARWTNNKKNQLRIGDNVVLGKVEFNIHEKGKLIIGHYTAISGLRVECTDEVTIGKYCQISYNVNIHDNNSHPPEKRKSQMLGKESNSIYLSEIKPVHIGDNVWIGHDVTIMKGVTIGENSIIATGSIVTKDVLPNTIVAGNSAKPVEQINSDK